VSRPSGRGREEAEQAGALRHLRAQGLRVAPPPAGERPRPAAFAGLAEGEGHDCTGREFGVRALGKMPHLLVHSAQQCDHTVLGRHTACALGLKALTHLNLDGLSDYLSTRGLCIPCQTNTIGY
jgi:hypothetical protein